MSAQTLLPRILLVEDNEFSRYLLIDYLTNAGYKVLGLSDGGPSGSTLFQSLVQFQPHLIILDLKLPGVSGYSLLEQIKQNPEFQHLPIIVISAHAFKVDQERAMSLGANRYFVKPTNLNYLVQAINEELHPFFSDC
jgi:CheY-like chemotaxis protein